MALTRRSGSRFEANIWPGFVDAMTALLLVLVFVLSIFMIVQFMLRETITSQDTELDQLSDQVRSLAEALGLEQQRGFTLEQEVGRLDGALQQQLAETEAQAALVASLTTQTEAQQGQIASFEEQVASLLSERTDLQTRVTGLTSELSEANEARETATEQAATLSARIEDIEAGLAREITAREAAQLALAQARDEVNASTQAARLAAARREALTALIADLRNRNADAAQQLQATSEQLSAAQAAQLADAAAAEALRERLQNADAELTAMTLRLEEERAKAEETLTLLAAANSAERELDAQLAAALADALRAQSTANTSQSALSEAADREARLAADLAAAQAAQADAAASVTDLRTQLAAAQAAQSDTAASETGLRSELTAAQAALSETQAREASLRTQLAAAQAAQSDTAASEINLRAELAAALAAARAARDEAGTALTEAQERSILLGIANQALGEEQAASAESQRRVAALNQQVATLRQQIGGLQDLLNEAESRDSSADVQIAALGSQLNTALARVAAEEKRRAALEEAERKRLEEEAKELKSYRSEFFGQMRQLLGDQDGIRIVGDRFVFSSEVLFQPGQAELSIAGRGEVSKISDILRRISQNIPNGLDWVIRVDGHTDNVPLSGFGAFADNWELSQARALSVVRYMSEVEGIPPQRLAANGFGEHQPIATGDSPAARAQNRRIELKLTER